MPSILLPAREHFVHVLSNGLKVVTVEAPYLRTVLVTAYVRLGSRHEPAGQGGVSHLLEHLFFRGCEAFPEGRRMNARVEDVGGSLNGVTARDHGYYFTPSHADHVDVAVETLGAMLLRPRLTDLDIEREVILEEMLDEVDEEGRDIDIDNLSKRLIFGSHGLGRKIAGTPESVRSITLDDLWRHHARHYVASNLVLVVAGPVSHARMVDLAQLHLDGFPSGAPTVDDPPPAWPHGPQIHHVDNDDSQVELRWSFGAPPEAHPDMPAVETLRRVLDDGLSSRLQVEIVEKRGLAYAVGAGLDTFSDAGIFEIDVACAPAKVPLVVEQVTAILSDLRAHGATAEELHRARVRHRVGLDFLRDSSADLAGWYGGTELFRPAQTIAQRREAFERVTDADVRRLAAQIFDPQRLVFVTVGSIAHGIRQQLESTLLRHA